MPYSLHKKAKVKRIVINPRGTVHKKFLYALEKSSQGFQENTLFLY